MSLIEKEYERLDVLKAEGTFIALDLKPDKSGGTLQMQGQSKDEVEIAVQSLPLYPTPIGTFLMNQRGNWRIFILS